MLSAAPLFVAALMTPPLTVAGRMERGSIADVDLNGYQLGVRWQRAWTGELALAGLTGPIDATALTALGGYGFTWFEASAGVRWFDGVTPAGRIRLGPAAVHLAGAYALSNPVWPGIGATRAGLGLDWRGFEGFAGYAWDITEREAITAGVRAPLGPRLGLYISGALGPDRDLLRMGVGVGWRFGGTPDVLPELPVDGAPPMRGRRPTGNPPASQPRDPRSPLRGIPR